jgi:hypothetical protein
MPSKLRSARSLRNLLGRSNDLYSASRTIFSHRLRAKKERRSVPVVKVLRRRKKSPRAIIEARNVGFRRYMTAYGASAQGSRRGLGSRSSLVNTAHFRGGDENNF